MKKNLKILGVEDTKEGKPRVTQAGKPYARIKTEDGWMSCFNTKASEDLKAFIDKVASIEVIESGNFSNITKCYGEPESEDNEVEIEKVPKEIKVSKPQNGQAMYVSYAKDIFCVLHDKEVLVADTMQLAINLVKQAKKAFE